MAPGAPSSTTSLAGRRTKRRREVRRPPPADLHQIGRRLNLRPVESMLGLADSGERWFSVPAKPRGSSNHVEAPPTFDSRGHDCPPGPRRDQIQNPKAGLKKALVHVAIFNALYLFGLIYLYGRSENPRLA